MRDGFLKKIFLQPIWLLAPVLGCLVFLYVSTGDNFIYTQWSVRDLIRSFNLLNEFQVMGAEMDYGDGMRIPGGFLHYLWFIPLAFTSSVTVSFYFTVVLNLLALFVLFRMTARYFGAGAALFTSVVFLVSDIFYVTACRLWNPAFVPLFIVLAYDCACRVLIDGRNSYVKWFFLAVALGAQIHMSALLLFVPFIAAWLMFVPGRSGSEKRFEFIKDNYKAVLSDFAFGILFFIVPFIPYLVSEFMNGFPNTAMLFGQYALAEAEFERGAAQLPLTAWRIISRFIPFRPGEDNASGLLFLVFGNLSRLMILAGFAGVFRLLCCPSSGFPELKPGALRKFGVLAVLVFVCSVFYYTRAGSMYLLAQIRMLRYVFILLPAVAVIAGAGCVWILGSLRNMSHAAVALVLVIVFGFCVQVYGSGIYQRRVPYEEYSYSQLKERREAVVRMSGWGLEEMAGRVMLLLPDVDRGWIWSHLADFASYGLFVREGKFFPGSGPLPGVVILRQALDILGREIIENPDITDAQFAKIFFKYDLPGFRILDKTTIGSDLIVKYTYDRGRAFASMTTKYIFTPEEKEIAAFYGKMEQSTLRLISGQTEDSPEKYVICMFPSLFVMVELSCPGQGSVIASLHSNQLRGPSFNRGLFQDAMLEHPRLVFRNIDTGTQEELYFVHGFAGVNGILAPFSSGMTIGKGVYEVAFECNVIADIGYLLDNKSVELDKFERYPFRIVLGPVETQ